MKGPGCFSKSVRCLFIVDLFCFLSILKDISAPHTRRHVYHKSLLIDCLFAALDCHLGLLMHQLLHLRLRACFDLFFGGIHLLNKLLLEFLLLDWVSFNYGEGLVDLTDAIHEVSRGRVLVIFGDGNVVLGYRTCFLLAKAVEVGNDGGPVLLLNFLIIHNLHAILRR